MNNYIVLILANTRSRKIVFKWDYDISWLLGIKDKKSGPSVKKPLNLLFAQRETSDPALAFTL